MARYKCSLRVLVLLLLYSIYSSLVLQKSKLELKIAW